MNEILIMKMKRAIPTRRKMRRKNRKLKYLKYFNEDGAGIFV